VGYGGGFYDRYIAELNVLPPKIICGLGFDEQVIAEVPIERHDLNLTHIATPTQIYRCNPEQG
jgi:5-formyltetrahydrofolate cyclo-ligase